MIIQLSLFPELFDDEVVGGEFPLALSDISDIALWYACFGEW